MKPLLLAATASLLFLVGTNWSTAATGSVVAVEVDETQRQPRRMVHVGGYGPADMSHDPYIDQSASLVLETLQQDTASRYNFATKAVSYRIIKAEQQVVAGMNYRLTLLFGDQEEEEETEDDKAGGGGDCVGACRVIVYNHFGDLSITKWSKELSCEEALAMEDDEAGDEN